MLLRLQFLERQLLTGLLADPAGADLPAGIVEDLLRLGRIERVARLQLVEPAPDALGEHAHGRPVDTEEELVDDRLAIDRPVQGLAHRELRRRRSLDVDEPADRWASADGLDERETRVRLESRVIRFRDLVDEQALAGLERRGARAEIGHRAEAHLIEVRALLVREEVGCPRVVGVGLQGDDAIRGPAVPDEGPGTHERGHVLAHLRRVEQLRREDAEVRPPELVRQAVVRGLEREDNGPRIGRADRVDVTEERCDPRRLRLRIEDPVPALLHGGRVERRAVVERHAVAEGERPRAAVGVDQPLRRE